MHQPILIAPGIGNSGPEHWQSLWQAHLPGARRLAVPDWDHVDCIDWVAAIAREIAASGPETVIVAHSLGCLAVAHWAARTSLVIRGALLVAPPDPDGPAFPAGDARGFTPLPLTRFTFPSLVVTSNNDPYGSEAHAQTCAAGWGSDIVYLGALGHLNAASGIGDWEEGLALLARLTA